MGLVESVDHMGGFAGPLVGMWVKMIYQDSSMLISENQKKLQQICMICVMRIGREMLVLHQAQAKLQGGSQEIFDDMVSKCRCVLSLGDPNIPPQTRYNKLFGEAFLGPLVRLGCDCKKYALDSHTVVGYHSFQVMQRAFGKRR